MYRARASDSCKSDTKICNESWCVCVCDNAVDFLRGMRVCECLEYFVYKL